MKIADKTLNKYINEFKWFLIIAFIIVMIVVVLRLSFDLPPEIMSILALLAAIITVWAGWRSVRKYGYDFRQTGFVGFLLFLATNWSLPIFHSVLEVLSLALVNTSLFVIFTSIGGLLGKLLTRHNKL